MTIDPRQFRNALGCFATGVTVVTAQAAGRPAIGITANSFSSVSLDPPLVLWCLDKKSDTFPVFEAASLFAINILREADQEISSRLARRGQHELNGLPLKTGKTGLPLLEDALALFECEVESRHDAGDHIILVGRVVAFDYVVNGGAASGGPLIYYRGDYRSVTG